MGSKRGSLLPKEGYFTRMVTSRKCWMATGEDQWRWRDKWQVGKDWCGVHRVKTRCTILVKGRLSTSYNTPLQATPQSPRIGGGWETHYVWWNGNNIWTPNWLDWDDLCKQLYAVNQWRWDVVATRYAKTWEVYGSTNQDQGMVTTWARRSAQSRALCRALVSHWKNPVRSQTTVPGISIRQFRGATTLWVSKIWKPTPTDTKRKRINWPWMDQDKAWVDLDSDMSDIIQTSATWCKRNMQRRGGGIERKGNRTGIGGAWIRRNVPERKITWTELLRMQISFLLRCSKTCFHLLQTCWKMAFLKRLTVNYMIHETQWPISCLAASLHVGTAARAIQLVVAWSGAPFLSRHIREETKKIKVSLKRQTYRNLVCQSRWNSPHVLCEKAAY